MTIAEIIEQLEKATEPSAEIDFWITVRVWDVSEETDEALQADIDQVGIEGMCIEKPFTSSIDAVVSLCEQVLPGHGWGIESNTSHIKACLDPDLGEPCAKHPHWAAVSNTSTRQFEDAATPALALCLAVLKAKQAQEVTA